MINLTEKTYEKFTTNERVNLTLAAFARNDEIETDHLARTCPTKKYIANDEKYVATMESIEWISLNFLILCQFFCGKIREYDLKTQNSKLFEVYEDLLPEKISNEKLSTDGLSINISTEANADWIENLESLRDESIACLKAINQAFIEFCDEININSEYIYAWLNLTEICSDFSKCTSMAVEVDKQYFKESKALFYKAWKANVNNLLL